MLTETPSISRIFYNLEGWGHDKQVLSLSQGGFLEEVVWEQDESVKLRAKLDGGEAQGYLAVASPVVLCPSASTHPCPQVPIIPVVYSSFSSFYNVKTKLFTSGE